MRAKRWIRAMLWAAAVGATATLGLRPWGAARADDPPKTDTAQTIDQDIDQQGDILNDAAATPEQKDEAARVLVLRNSPKARDILDLALSQGRTRVCQNAVAKALAADPHPDARFIEHLVPLLGRDTVSTEAAARALANTYKQDPRVLDYLIGFAKDQRPGLEASRAAAIRAIGAIVSKEAVAALIQLTQNPGDNSSISNAATDALVEITGEEDLARDVPRWIAWWASNRDIPAADLRAQWLNRRDEKVGRLQTEFQLLGDDVKAVLQATYQQIGDSKLPALQAKLLSDWLRNSEAAVRLAAVKIANDDWGNSGRMADPIKQQLRSMAGDSSIEVRLEVIKTLRDISDAEALAPLLKQLKLEKDPDVIAEIARALGPLGKVEAVDPLLELLNDPTLRVREAAAHSLAQLGAQIRAEPGVAREAAARLKETLNWADQKQGTTILIEECVDALSKLELPELREVFDSYTSVTDRNTPKIRRSAYLGLGSIKGLGPNVNDTIANSLATALERETDRNVKLGIIDAIGEIGDINQADALHRRMTDPREWPDVRAEAWKVLLSFFARPQTKAVDLARWAATFGNDNDPARQREALLAQIPKLQAEHRDDVVAEAQEDLGNADMKLTPPKSEEAVTAFGPALDYWKKPASRGTAATIETLTDELMKARLEAKQYPEAMKLASQSIADDPKMAEDIGRAICKEVVQLREAGDRKTALDLINATDSIHPPLQGQYKSQLDQWQIELKQPPTPPG